MTIFRSSNPLSGKAHIRVFDAILRGVSKLVRPIMKLQLVVILYAVELFSSVKELIRNLNLRKNTLTL